MMINVVQQADGVRLGVKVVPGASRDRIVGPLGDVLKIAVSKPPQDGAANQAVVSLLCEALSLPRGSVSIVRGHSNPRKELLVRGITAEQLLARLQELRA